MPCAQPSRIMPPSVRGVAAWVGVPAAPVFGVVGMGAFHRRVHGCSLHGVVLPAVRASSVGALAAAHVRDLRVLGQAGQHVFGEERR